MTHKHQMEWGPALVVAFGIVVSTAIAMQASEAGVLVVAAPLLLAGSLMAADILRSWKRRASLRPSLTAVVASLALVVACAILIYRDPSLIVTILPIIGAGSAVAVLRRSAPRQ
jgi:hypothetical protein